METLTSDVVLDIVAILEEASESGRLVGSEETTIDEIRVVSSANLTASRSTIQIKLSNGDFYEFTVRPR